MPKVSVTIITLNEAEHIAAAIDSAAWADEVIVVDSGSRDATTQIARQKGARVSERAWTGWIDQKNHAATLASHDWIFSLDADERVTPASRARFRRCFRTSPHGGATARRGSPITSGNGCAPLTSIRTFRPVSTIAAGRDGGASTSTSR
jgi:glycosyltransferase involved in cell wall biosynthesis